MREESVNGANRSLKQGSRDPGLGQKYLAVRVLFQCSRNEQGCVYATTLMLPLSCTQETHRQLRCTQ